MHQGLSLLCMLTIWHLFSHFSNSLHAVGTHSALLTLSLQVLEGHTDEVFSCAFNYEGDTILTCLCIVDVFLVVCMKFFASQSVLFILVEKKTN